MAPSILIVDPSQRFADALRPRLVPYGSRAHIFASYKAALMLLNSNKIDSVVVPFDAAREAIEFCETVKSLGVPLVYTASNYTNMAIDPAWNVGGTHASSTRLGTSNLTHDGS